jgi:electron transport complex protein RnfD
MRFRTVTSPHILEATSVGRVMRRVLYAMVARHRRPDLVLSAGAFSVNLAIATTMSLLVAETAMLAARGKPHRAASGRFTALSSPPGCWRWRCRRWRRGG